MKVKNGAQETLEHLTFKLRRVGRTNALAVATERKLIEWRQKQENRAHGGHMTKSTLGVSCTLTLGVLRISLSYR